MKWISVKDLLPENESKQQILAYIGDAPGVMNNMVVLLDYKNNKWRSFLWSESGDTFEPLYPFITHWLYVDKPKD